MPNKDLSINQGGIKASGWAMEGNKIACMYFEALAKIYKFSLDEPINNLNEDVLD